MSVKVNVVDYGRRYLMLRYIDPLTGKQKSKSARTANMREAEKAAGKWEAELREGRYHEPLKTTWESFRERYETEVLPGLATGTAVKVGCVFDSVEAILSPKRLVDLTEQRISSYQAKLREAGRAESTIKSNLAHLKAALRWAERIGILVKAPRITMPKRAKSSKGTDPMKGRPVTTEEFERMLAKVEAGLLAVNKPKVKPKKAESVRPASPMSEEHKARLRAKAARWAVERSPTWRHFLNGLWLSGLRLSESLELSWDDHGKLTVDLCGRFPMLRIKAAAEKGNRDRLLPLAPDFAEWLAKTPESERTGFVFNPLDGSGKRASSDGACRTITAIGKAAGVKVRDDGGKVKFASAHDLRRSFGERWAVKVMPQVLQQLMRHETIETTLRFYVGRNAETMARALWDAHAGNSSGNNGYSREAATSPKSMAEAGIEPARGLPLKGF